MFYSTFSGQRRGVLLSRACKIIACLAFVYKRSSFSINIARCGWKIYMSFNTSIFVSCYFYSIISFKTNLQYQTCHFFLSFVIVRNTFLSRNSMQSLKMPSKLNIKLLSTHKSLLGNDITFWINLYPPMQKDFPFVLKNTSWMPMSLKADESCVFTSAFKSRIKNPVIPNSSEMWGKN